MKATGGWDVAACLRGERKDSDVCLVRQAPPGGDEVNCSNSICRNE